MDAVRWSSDSPTGLPGKLRLIDQTLLPEKLVYVELDEREAIFDAIKRLVVRGAPAIGCAAALGLAAVAQHYTENFEQNLNTDAEYLKSSRPTAVNLAWAVDRCLAVMAEKNGLSLDEKKLALLDEARKILEEDIEMCRQIGLNGAKLFKKGARVLTHCNAGALATSDYGTALSPIYVAQEQGLEPKVFADETRPLLQGSRLTAWELNRENVDVTVICDNMAGYVMQQGMIDMVIVGSDRIAANGDAANKIGTYSVAVLAKHHGIPFYVAAPSSTFDLSLAHGGLIPIEQRDSKEISNGFGKQTAPYEAGFYNPAFDVTPAELIVGIITEKGIIPAEDFGKIPSIIS